MKDLIIPSAIVGAIFLVILLGVGFWVLTRGGTQDSRVTEAQQQAESLINSMDTTTQTNTQPEGESYEITPGLIAQDVTMGTGEPVIAGQTVLVKYTGMLTDGTVFDASERHAETVNGFSFQLGAGGVIKGWDLGVAGMKPGGVRMLTIAPELAYGDRDLGAIPPNSTLVFKVEMIGPVNQ